MPSEKIARTEREKIIQAFAQSQGWNAVILAVESYEGNISEAGAYARKGFIQSLFGNLIAQSRSWSGIQNPAYLAQTTRGKFATKLRRRAAELAAKKVREMRVAGKTEIESEHGKIRRAIREALQRKTQSQSTLIFVQAHAGFAAEDAREVERRAEDRSSESGKSHFLTEFLRDHDTRGGDEIAVSASRRLAYSSHRLALPWQCPGHALRQ